MQASLQVTLVHLWMHTLQGIQHMHGNLVQHGCHSLLSSLAAGNAGDY